MTAQYRRPSVGCETCSKQEHKVRRRAPEGQLAGSVRPGAHHLTTCLLVAVEGPEARYSRASAAAGARHWPGWRTLRAMPRVLHPKPAMPRSLGDAVTALPL